MARRAKKKKNYALWWIGAAISIALIISGYMILRAFTSPSEPAKAKSKFEFQKGMCYVTWTKDRYASMGSDESLKALAKTGTKWVALVVNWYQDTCYTTSIFSTAKSPSDESVIHAIKTIHGLGMKVMLKPHLDVLDTSGGNWRGEIACIADPDWDKWFESYGEFISHYALIAQEHNVELLCIGTELTSVATIKETLWKTRVIEPVRAIYKGPLTYAANWSDEFTHVKFWDEMDYVGIDAYFPLSDKERPTLEEIKAGWSEWAKEVEIFQAKVDKPIIFPEIGYCSATGTAKTPWEEIVSGEVDLELQANCYRAIFELFWDKEWFYGVYWWKWGTDVRFGGPQNKSYSIQNKPALDVVKEWYARPDNVKRKY